MSRIVKPVRVKKMRVADVPIGALFALDGVRYVKLAEKNENNADLTRSGVLATTILPLCECDSVYHGKSEKTLQERVSCMFLAATTGFSMCDDGIVNYGVPDTDDFRRFGHIMYPHIKDAWYLAMGVDDAPSFEEHFYKGEYFYVDEFGNLCEGNEYDEKEDGVFRRLSLRVLFAIDPDREVTVLVKSSNKKG